MEELFSAIELGMPIELIDPRITRYTVGRKFTKIGWDEPKKCLYVISKQTGRKAFIGMNFVKAFFPIDAAPEVTPEKRGPGRPAKVQG